MLIKLQFSLG